MTALLLTGILSTAIAAVVPGPRCSRLGCLYRSGVFVVCDVLLLSLAAAVGMLK